jgi:glutamate carboxypeptidase
MTTPWMPEALGELVSCESPSEDPEATRRCGELTTELVRAHLGAEPERIEVQGRTHLRWTWGAPRVLLVGHLDTVWPHGTLARWPYRVDGDQASGPGVFDMKAGVVQAVAALSQLPRLDGVSLLLTVDEELGSPTSADLVVESARGCAAALVCEPSAGGALKTARKGIALYELLIQGRAAHAGLEPEKGVNAALALAHAVLGVAALGDVGRGTTVTPTLSKAGTTTNTVPARAQVAVDARAADPEELLRVDRELRRVAEEVALAVPGSSVEVLGGVNRPPLDARSSAALFALAQEVAGRLGMPALQGISVGGGSDGNFTAGAGVPTLDGLGAVGDGAHAEGEHVLLSQLEPRARLLAGIVDDLLVREGVA